MLRYDGIAVWGDDEVRSRLSWYYDVMRNRRPAKFLLCKMLACDMDLKGSSEDQLWSEHKRLAEVAEKFFRRVAERGVDIEEFGRPRVSFLDLKNEILQRGLRHCYFCEWRCRIDRDEGARKTACRLNSTTRVSSCFHHFGEEAPLVGAFGSGTIFFASCNFRCVFCQNWDISQDARSGAPVDGRGLALIMKQLGEQGASNINLVGGEPTPNIHTIVDALTHLEVNVPILWNSNMYCSEELMNILKDIIDIWLPDFKYGNDACALRLSKVPRYMQAVSRNHAIASAHGGMIIRHLILPGHLECCTKPVLDLIAKDCPRALVNIMDQYHPDHLVLKEPERYLGIARRPRIEEVEQAYAYARRLGLLFEPVS